METPTRETVVEVPWWIKFAYQFGIPAALSIYLIWLMAGRIEGKINDLEENLRTHQADSTFSVRSGEAQMQRLNEIYLILQRICVNGASNQADRNACFDKP